MSERIEHEIESTRVQRPVDNTHRDTEARAVQGMFEAATSPEHLYELERKRVLHRFGSERIKALGSFLMKSASVVDYVGPAIAALETIRGKTVDGYPLNGRQRIATALFTIVGAGVDYVAQGPGIEGRAVGMMLDVFKMQILAKLDDVIPQVEEFAKRTVFYLEKNPSMVPAPAAAAYA